MFLKISFFFAQLLVFNSCLIIFVRCGDKFQYLAPGRGARVVEEARLESVYTPKGYRGFESRSLRNT